ncbi:MAG TPA: glycine zipper 2TM domain-containing protein [Steroidobacteraceae bacterium]|nr:glycine zipper 2TM domain-containing protein [Steroidobacteraceae bacterium]
MFSKVVTSGVVAIGVLGAPAAFADHQSQDWQDDSYRAGPSYDYAKVISTEPITRQVRVDTPRRECWTDTYYEDRSYGYGERPGTAGRMILGGLIGAAIGNQIGHGDGRRAATVAGALIGTAIGHDAGSRAGGPPVVRQSVPRDVERCEVRYETTYENHVEGYNVVYVYDGQRHRTRLPYDPGERIRVRVDVSPAER